MERGYKGIYKIAACILSIILVISILEGCSDKEGEAASGKDSKTVAAISEEAAPTEEAEPVQEAEAPTPTVDTTPTPAEGGGDAASTESTHAVNSANTGTSNTTKKMTTTPAPTISQSDKGTTAIVENGSAPVSTNIIPKASGEEVYSNDKAVIDASNKADGYIMVKYIGGSGYKIKVRITVPDGTVYTYNLNSSGSYETFPLSGGNGSYAVKVCRNVYETKYATDFSQAISVTLKNEFAPFLHANQYVNFNSSSKAVAAAKQITSGCSSELDKVQKVYTYVVTNISYDYNKASTVSSGYVPDIDSVLTSKKGICFDYAALMTAMLRSLKIPTKLVVGYAGSAYHAWISVYVSVRGWIDGVIYFDGNSWQLMDPTLASTQGSEAIKNTTYSAKYLY